MVQPLKVISFSLSYTLRYYLLKAKQNNTMKPWIPYFSTHAITFASPIASLFVCQAIWKNHCPTCSVIFWQSPRKNYVFLCLSGSCLLFSMCEGKKWVGEASDVFVGVRLDDMVREGIGFGPLGGKGSRGARRELKYWCATGFCH